MKNNSSHHQTDQAIDPIRLAGTVIKQLKTTQWWDAARLEVYHFNKLRRVLQHALATIPFYQRLYEGSGIAPEEISSENWSDIPILSRELLQRNPLLSHQIPLTHGKTAAMTTSGSTGEPVTITTTEYAQAIWQAFSLREHLWHQRDFSGRHASIKYAPQLKVPKEGLLFPNWGAVMSRFVKTGPSMFLCIKNSIDRQLEWLQQQDPDYLVTYPSNLKALLERSQELGIRFSRLKEVRTVGETVGPTLRGQCRAAWQVGAIDTYSSQEAGYIAIQCPTGDHYHVQAENVYLEVLDQNNQTCLPGEVGRIVMTTLHNFATPLIRYEIRDYAEVGEPCSCGRGLPVLKRILGRQRNMLVYPDGRRSWPIFGMLKFREVAPIRQMQFVQHEKNLLEMNYTTDKSLTAEEQQLLEKMIQQSLGHPFRIRFSELNKIPQRENGKVEDFISKLV